MNTTCKASIFLLLAPPGYFLLCFGCGEGGAPPANTLTDKIVGGRDAEEGEFPWQASLQRLTVYGFFHTCGASLLTREWLATAAHCITENSTKKFRIMIGSNNLTSATLSQFYRVKMIVIKQGFDPGTFTNDIALIHLARPVPTSISAICLTDQELQHNSMAVVTGWGATENGGKASPYLQAADVGVILREECTEYYIEEVLKDSMTCAGYEKGGTDACQGDSGGPLLQWRNGRAHLVGITSWGVGCAEPFQPGVYTDIYAFASWIKKYISAEDEQITK